MSDVGLNCGFMHKHTSTQNRKSNSNEVARNTCAHTTTLNTIHMQIFHNTFFFCDCIVFATIYAQPKKIMEFDGDACGKYILT